MLTFFPLMTLMADAARVIEIRLRMMARHKHSGRNVSYGI